MLKVWLNHLKTTHAHATCNGRKDFLSPQVDEATINCHSVHQFNEKIKKNLFHTNISQDITTRLEQNRVWSRTMLVMFSLFRTGDNP